jgi:hypothetical protein
MHSKDDDQKSRLPKPSTHLIASMMGGQQHVYCRQDAIPIRGWARVARILGSDHS